MKWEKYKNIKLFETTFSYGIISKRDQVIRFPGTQYMFHFGKGTPKEIYSCSDDIYFKSFWRFYKWLNDDQWKKWCKENNFKGFYGSW